MNDNSHIEQYIRNIPDFPKPGIQFKDITPLLAEPKAFQHAIKRMSELVNDLNIDVVSGIESRGFLFGMALASYLTKGFAPIRKPGKLPHETYSSSYDLEYGSDSVEIHKDAIKEGQNVLLVDDLLATGGTAAASVELIERCGGKIASCLFLIELPDLGGRNSLNPHRIESLIQY